MKETIRNIPKSNNETIAYLRLVIDNPQTAIVQQQINGNIAKMLIILLDGKQRLITFDIPIHQCTTVQDLLELVKVLIGTENMIYLVNDPVQGINYIVEEQPPAMELSNLSLN
ncbi:uncharacterized protein LOC127290194 [Leptopilina boulardi]|uniref:uncharacterized protein LOC127290194 n=1 Tax=Leptopilina boulardi TaxID=63433 RepID=UPI0021F5EDBF|nr:uncharacterized protein LOC127290194 [Leptopilina boulardi]